MGSGLAWRALPLQRRHSQHAGALARSGLLVRRRLPGGGGDQGAEDAGVRGRGHGDGRRELESLDPREFEFRGGGERVGEGSLRH